MYYQEFIKLNRRFKYFLLVSLLLLVFFAGYFVKSFVFQSQFNEITGYPIREGGNLYKLINPLLAYEISDTKNFFEFKPLEKKLSNLITQKENSGLLSNIGIYFRDFNSGKWTGVNENVKFSPASLLKVPLLPAFSSESERSARIKS